MEVWERFEFCGENRDNKRSEMKVRSQRMDKKRHRIWAFWKKKKRGENERMDDEESNV